MDKSDGDELHRRISQLEDDVHEIQESLERLALDTTDSSTPPPAPISRVQSHPHLMSERPIAPQPLEDQLRTNPPLKPDTPKWELPEHMRQGDFWLKMVGIALTLFGVGFGFKYSIDQGWINPMVRHLFGLAVGMALLAFGLRLYGKRPRFAQVLLGGSVGTFYITCFSAFQLFELISHPVAFGCMIVISIASFWISVNQDKVVFSLIGMLGALGTPFLLYTGSGDIPGLVLYTEIVLISTAVVYFFRGWRLLLWLSMVAGILVLIIGTFGGELWRPAAAGDDRWAMQAGLIATWLTYWLVPVMRRVVRSEPRARLRAGLLGIGDKDLREKTKATFDNHVHVMTILPAIASLLLSSMIWIADHQHALGWSTMGAAALYGLATIYLRRHEPLRNLAFTHGVVGTMLFTYALMFLLKEHTLLFVLATEGLALHLIARRLSDKRIARGGNTLFIMVAFWVLARLAEGTSETPAFFNAATLVDLWAIACGVAAAFVCGRLASRRVYLVAAAGALGMLFHRESSGDLLFLLLTIETAGFFLLARKLKDTSLHNVSHAAWAGMANYLVLRLVVTRAAEIAFLNIEAGANLLLILAAIGATFWLTNARDKSLYLLAVHIGLLGLLAHELLPLENGQGVVSIAWGIYGALLLIVGLRRNLHVLRLCGLGTLMLVVAKLFVVDLARIETIWRVLLFVGFGATFLALSYYFPKLWKREEPVEGDAS
jgi:uncharacterized membrane protein